MSKQAKAKKELGYIPKPVPHICSNCENYRSDFVKNEYDYTEEKNKRCGIGNFAVKKTATCEKGYKLKTYDL